MKHIFTLFGFIFGLLGLSVTYKDVMASDRPWHAVGEIWFLWAPSSLQQTESIISRYIDPCGLFVALDCEPFIWHPGVSTLLNWYAAPTFLVTGFVLALIGRWLGNRKKRLNSS